jgi:hypothetical protein
VIVVSFRIQGRNQEFGTQFHKPGPTDKSIPDLHNKIDGILYGHSVYKTIISPALYGCEAWPLTLIDVYRLRVFENRVLRKIFGSKEEVIGGRRKLHHEKLHH